MYKKLLVFITLFLMNTSLWAMDLNQTTTIINEAQEATTTLQGELNSLLEETVSMVEDVNENNNSNPINEKIIMVTEINETIEANEYPQPTEPIDIQVIDINENIENNNSLEPSNVALLTPSIEINISNEANNTLATLESPEVNNSLIVKPMGLLDAVQEVNQSNDVNDSVCIDENTSLTNNVNTHKNDLNISNDTTVDCTDMQGDSMRGLTLFKTRIKPFCDMTGEKFAKQYTQEDWDDIFYDKEFKKEVIKACPNIEKRYKNSWTPHLYQFALEYASDSDTIPEC